MTHRRNSWHRHPAILASLIAMLFLVLPAAAQTPTTDEATPPPVPRFSIQPIGDYPKGYFELELKPGESTELRVRVGLTSDSAPVKLRTYSTNALMVVNGGFGAGTEADAPVGATTWVTYPAQSFDFNPSEYQELPVTISVPDDTQPGQYAAALVAQTDGPVAIPGMDTFNQIIRSAISVFITVPGELTPSFTLGTPTFDLESGAPRLIIPVQNTGNMIVKPAGNLTIASPDGQIVTTAPIAMGSVYAGYATTIEIALPEQMKPGDYVVSGTLTDPESTASASIDSQTTTLAAADEAPPQFTIDPFTVTANADPVQFANVSLTVNNGGAGLPTAKIVLRVSHDGTPVEDYTLTENQALANGATTIEQRYIPATGWESGTYSFEIVISSVNTADGTETILATQPARTNLIVP